MRGGVHQRAVWVRELRPVEAVAGDHGVDEHDVLGVAESGGPRPRDNPARLAGRVRG